MEQVCEKNKKIFIDYIQQEPQFTVYMTGNLDNYGLMNENVKIFFEYSNGIKAALMKYYDDFVLYTKGDAFNPSEVLNKIRELSKEITNLSCITGKMSSLLELTKNKSIYCRHTYIMELQARHFINKVGRIPVQRLHDTDVETILSLYCNVPEMQDKYARSSEEETQDVRHFMMTGRIYGVSHNGKIISSVATTAENKKQAMLINVCTLPAYRRRGYCESVLSTLSNDLFEEGKEKIFIYYENQMAGKIYEKIGFRHKGDYGRIGLKELLDKESE